MGPQQQEEDVYDVPTTRRDTAPNGFEIYDVPPSVSRLAHSNNVASSSSYQQQDETDVVYDIPQSNLFNTRRPISSGLNSLKRMRRELTSSQRQQQAGGGGYSVKS